MLISCLDLEGVLVPEIWVAVAERTGIEALNRTTRDEPDYDTLMRHRITILERERIGIREIESAIDGLDPLPGAREFLDELRREMQVVILSDTFSQFAAPLMAKLGWPSIFCHRLVIERGAITGYQLRMPDQKRAAVAAFRTLRFRTIAVGDSYNDISMLSEADTGIFFRPPLTIASEFQQFPVAHDYDGLRDAVHRGDMTRSCGSA